MTMMSASHAPRDRADAANEPPTGLQTPQVLFISGFHRSGTTLVASAATAATGGITLTVGHLADRMPSLGTLLRTPRSTPVDRGVDRLAVTADTPEEYGWLLYQAKGRHALRREDVHSGFLRTLVDDIAGPRTSRVVLKSPWDTGAESLLLEAVPDSRVLLVRRGVAAIEDSSRRALLRFVTSDEYLRALMADDRNVRTLLGALAQPRWRRVVLLLSRWRFRLGVLRLAAAVARLPPERVAFVSYEELRADPAAGAAWAAHLLDPTGLADAFTATAFVDSGGARRGGWVTRALDAYWARAWRRARAAQVAAGILTPGGPTRHG
jgi:hypothetical protein